jgi:pyruvate dehydrogenase (quinone)
MPTVADLVVDRLRAWGVRRVFGYSGDGIDGVMGALRRAGGDPAFVQARHEESAAFMACAHAKFTGGLGVCTSTQGPGAVHLLNGLYDAALDHVPVLAIVGQQVRTALGSTYLQEIDIVRLYGDVCAYVQQVDVPDQLPMVLDRAVRAAFAARGPACIVLPHDVQQLDAPAPEAHEHGVMRSSAAGWSAPRLVPGAEDLAAASALLDGGDRVAILIGQGARAAAAEVAEIAEALQAGVAKALLGKPVLDDALPYVTGALGHLGTTASHELMMGCDTLLMVGTNEPWTKHLPPPGQARAVQIDIDGRNLGYRYPTEVNLLGDAAETLRALLPRLRRRPRSPWREQVERWIRDWRVQRDQRADEPADPVNPQAVVRGLSRVLPDSAIVCVDVGSVTYWYARDLDLRPGMQASLSSTLASMGCAVPYSVAAKEAHPHRTVVALLGDGAFQMLGMNELITVAHRWRGWSNPCLPILVLRNDDLNEVTWEQREMEGDPRFDASQDLPAFDYAGYARLLGLGATRVDDPAGIDDAWHQALTADRPYLIEAVVDPSVPLLAPHLPLAKARNIYGALSREPHAARATALFAKERRQEGERVR